MERFDVILTEQGGIFIQGIPVNASNRDRLLAIAKARIANAATQLETPEGWRWDPSVAPKDLKDATSYGRTSSYLARYFSSLSDFVRKTSIRLMFWRGLR